MDDPGEIVPIGKADFNVTITCVIGRRYNPRNCTPRLTTALDPRRLGTVLVLPNADPRVPSQGLNQPIS